MTEDYPRGKDTSGALTEVRTVLSRAETALVKMGHPGLEWQRPGYEDPDFAEMVAALTRVVSTLNRWRRI